MNRFFSFKKRDHPYGAQIIVENKDTTLSEISASCDGELHDGSYIVTVKITPKESNVTDRILDHLIACSNRCLVIKPENRGIIGAWIDEAINDPSSEPETTLQQYISNYIQHELGYLNELHNRKQQREFIHKNVCLWVANAFDAYGEGAR